MTPERWQRIEKIFQAATDCRTERLADFLDQACGSDDELRREVEALLAFQQPAPSFIRGVIHDAAAAIQPGVGKSSDVKPTKSKPKHQAMNNLRSGRNSGWAVSNHWSAGARRNGRGLSRG